VNLSFIIYHTDWASIGPFVACVIYLIYSKPLIYQMLDIFVVCPQQLSYGSKHLINKYMTVSMLLFRRYSAQRESSLTYRESSKPKPLALILYASALIPASGRLSSPQRPPSSYQPPSPLLHTQGSGLLAPLVSMGGQVLDWTEIV